MKRMKTASFKHSVRTFVREFLYFGLKQAQACVFGGYLLALVLLTHLWFPLAGLIHRYDFLFLAALAFQAVLLLFRLETWREAAVIFSFHVVATGLELFKTSDGIGAWNYPEPFTFGIGNVPLFAGFMYSAVGSYLARVFRIFDFRFSGYPPVSATVALVSLVYINFFSHHFFADLRDALAVLTVGLFARTWVYYKPDLVHRRMPLLLGWFLVALFIWFAENIATFSGVWLYPHQHGEWQMVSPKKLLAWNLLMLLSFVLVTLVHRPRAMAPRRGSRFPAPEIPLSLAPASPNEQILRTLSHRKAWENGP